MTLLPSAVPSAPPGTRLPAWPAWLVAGLLGAASLSPVVGVPGPLLAASCRAAAAAEFPLAARSLRVYAGTPLWARELVVLAGTPETGLLEGRCALSPGGVRLRLHSVSSPGSRRG